MTTLLALLVILLSIDQTSTFDMKIVGIYSICGDEYAENEFTKEGYAINMSASYTIDILNTKDLVNVRAPVIYKWFDVCFSHNRLVEVVNELMLDNLYYSHDETHFFGKNNSIDASRSSKILAILAHIQANWFDFLLDVFSMTNISISKHTNLNKTTSHIRNNDLSMYMQFGVNDIEQYLESQKIGSYYRWNEIIIIHSAEGDRFKPVFDALLEMAHRMNELCIKVLTVQAGTFPWLILPKRIAQTLQKHDVTFEKVRLVVYIGEIINVINLPCDYFHQDNFVIIFPEYRWTYFEKCIPYLMFSNSARNSIIDKVNLVDVEKVLAKFKINTTTVELINLKILSRYIADEFSRYWFSLHLYSNDFLVADTLSELLYDTLDLRKIPNSMMQSNATMLKSYHTSCDHPLCHPGYEKVFGRLSNYSTTWDEEYGYFCKPCQQNHYKFSYNDVKCQKCNGYLITNPYKTACIDPLVSVYHKYTSISGVIILSMCSVGWLSTLSVTIVFITHRNTPIVKISDFILSIVHVHIMMVMFSLLPILYFTEPTAIFCGSRTILIAVFYNMNISVICTKSFKLVSVFASKVKATKSEVLKTTLTQFVTIICNLFLAIFLNIVLWKIKLPDVTSRLDIASLSRILHCDNGFDNILMIILMFLLQLFCFVQAFRCRRLPSHFNEAMNMVYACFITTVSFLVMFPIYYSQKDVKDGELVQALVISGNTLVLFLFIYAKKIAFILLHPEKNTKQYFRRKQMVAMEMEAKNIHQTDDG